MLYDLLDTPLGVMLLAADDEGLRQVTFQDGPKGVEPPDSWLRDRNALKEAVRQLRAYFAGELREFSLPLAPRGTEFQRLVWRELTRIPYGATRSYGELAAALDKPQACRAVGGANGKNPLAIIQPCHRVIGKNGHLTGFASGLDRKRYLLSLEKVEGFL